MCIILSFREDKFMKKAIKFLSVILSLTIVFSCLTICASAAGESYLNFAKVGDAYQLSSCVATAKGEINIPETYNGLPVTSIAPGAFKERSNISKVTIPASIQSIGNSAFEQCTGLGTVVFEGKNCSIGTAAFRYCGTLLNVTLPSELTSIPTEAFAFCTNMVSITIPSTVKTISKEAFKCTNLRTVDIPASVTVIGTNAFISCPEVKAFNVDEANTAYKSIDGCLYDISGKTLIQFPNGKLVASYAVPAGTETIGDSAFGSNKKISSVTLPDTVKYIKAYAFNNCGALNAVILPDSIESIGSQAFGNCPALKQFTIPAKVTSFKSAFYNSALETVVISDGVTKIDEKAFEKCSKLNNISIPSSVTSVGMGAFDGCSSLELLYIPESVTNFGRNAFINCSNLTLVVKRNSAAHAYAESENIPCLLQNEPAQKTVLSISISTLPEKTVFEQGQTVDTAGLSIKVSYSDGTSAVITSGYQISPSVAQSIGISSITITYEGKTVSYNIDVAPSQAKVIEKITVKNYPKTSYNYKDTFDPSGLVITVHYTDGTTEDVSEGIETQSVTFKATGTHNVDITYQGVSTSIQVEVSYTFLQIIIMIFLLGFLWY